jgi:hypothetical protein
MSQSEATRGRPRSASVRSLALPPARSRTPAGRGAASASGSKQGRAKSNPKRRSKSKAAGDNERARGMDCQCSLCRKSWQPAMPWGETATKVVDGTAVVEAVGDLCKDCHPIGMSFPMSLDELAEKYDAEEAGPRTS